MGRKTAKSSRRSACPLSICLEVVGDRWSLLIIRDMMLRGSRSYNEFLQCGEKIATNVLADRLRKLEANGIIAVKMDASDGRRQIYELTRKGMDLAPILTEMVLWAGEHEQTGNEVLIRQLRNDKAKFMAQVRKNWTDRNS